LTKKLAIAVEQIHSDHGKLPIVIGGGVACNSALRAAVSEQFDHSYFVPPKYCTDNGAMIANLALRNASQAIPFPKTLYLDARGRFIQKDARKGSA